MKNLGKILIIFLGTFMPLGLFAGVSASVDYQTVVKGETVTYTLKLDGKDITRPRISTLCGSYISSSSSQTNIEMINGNYKRTYALSYTFVPLKSCTIEPIDITMDGKTYRSNSVSVTVKPAGSKMDADFSLELSSDKKEVYVGEPFHVKLIVKQKIGSNVVDSKFMAPDFKGFWKKGEKQLPASKGANFITTEVLYTLAAQRDGNLTIPSAQIAIASRSGRRDMWGSFMQDVKWRSYFSNELHIQAKPLPNNATLVGDFRLSATVDKKQINPNEAVNVTVKVVGEGNLEDIGSFKPYIQGVSAFDEKPTISGNVLTQKIALVSDENFTIPPFKLAFFNLKTKRVEQITTEPIAIKVNGGGKHKELIVKKSSPAEAHTTTLTSSKKDTQLDIFSGILLFIGGIIVGIGIMFLPKLRKEKEQKFNIKDEKALFIKLLPYKDDPEVQKILDILENNLYMSSKQPLDKKKIKEILQKYEHRREEKTKQT